MEFRNQSSPHYSAKNVSKAETEQSEAHHFLQFQPCSKDRLKELDCEKESLGESTDITPMQVETASITCVAQSKGTGTVQSVQQKMSKKAILFKIENLIEY
jgi:hypothetical protein